MVELTRFGAPRMDTRRRTRSRRMPIAGNSLK